MNDIEIYIREPDPKAVESWLQQRFEDLEFHSLPNGKAFSAQARIDGQPVPIKLFLNAAGNYASLCFDAPGSPWPDDLSCARDAWQVLGQEVRCATEGWQEEDESEDEFWWSLSDKGEQQIKWRM